MRMHFQCNKWGISLHMNEMKTLINNIINAMLVSQCILWKCTKYQKYWNAYSYVLTTWVWQLLSLTIPFHKGSANVWVSAEWMCQQPWSFCCCASEHMIFSSENKHFHNLNARLYFVDLPSLNVRAWMQKKNQSFGGWQFFRLFAPYSHGTFLYPKWQEEQPLGNFIQTVPEYREKTSQLGHLLLKNSFCFL